MYITNKEGKIKHSFEVCDKEYQSMLREDNSLNKYSALEHYINTLGSYDGGIEKITTGIDGLDNAMGGGLSSGLYVIGANPGLGKTSLVLHILVNLALKQKHSLFLNLEMSPFQVTTKLIANFSYRMHLSDTNHSKMTINNVSSKSVYDVKRKCYAENYRKLIYNYRKMVDPFINIISLSENNEVPDHSKCNNVESVETALQNYKKYHDITPIVVIDFLQLLQLKIDGNSDNATKQVDKRLEMNVIVDKLKRYSSVYKVPIIVISSLSRNAYTRETFDNDETYYNMSIFKETGHIEYTGDFLALLTKGPNKTSFSDDDMNTININVLKTRYCNYADEKIQLGFIPEHAYFQKI